MVLVSLLLHKYIIWKHVIVIDKVVLEVVCSINNKGVIVEVVAVTAVLEVEVTGTNEAISPIVISQRHSSRRINIH